MMHPELMLLLARDRQAALPAAGGEPLADPFAATAEILPLLELRAAQIRGVATRPRRRRLLPRRAY